eukprot:SAG31_NODE_3574_length_4113_cov_2.614848_6_plen_42_part_00
MMNWDELHCAGTDLGKLEQACLAFKIKAMWSFVSNCQQVRF